MSAVEEADIKILLSLDTPITIAAETKEQKTEVPSLTDITINQPWKKLRLGDQSVYNRET